MFYVLTDGDAIKQWPYTLPDLRADNPQTSFPANLTDAILSAWNVFPCEPVDPPPFDPSTQEVERIEPILSGTNWIEQWGVIDLTAEQAEEVQNAQWDNVRADRNSRLAACDWTQLPDAPVDSAEWATYRQALRDVTDQIDPFNIAWPKEPVA